MDLEVQFSLNEAQQFLIVAKFALESGLYGPAISNSAHSAIRSKDAICVKAKGLSKSTRRHADAVNELKSLGLLPVSSLRQFALVIDAKPRAEYQITQFSRSDAARCVQAAERFYFSVEKQLQT